jgi:hypothetical protein
VVPMRRQVSPHFNVAPWARCWVEPLDDIRFKANRGLEAGTREKLFSVSDAY